MAGNLTAMIASIFSGSAVTPDPFFEYTTLLLPGNGTNGAQNNTFLDGSTNNFSITRNGNTTQGTFSPFSQTGWSGAFNTSTTYLTVTDTSNLRFGSSNFTIETFVYRAASGATQTIASKGASTPTGWVFQISSADKLVFTDTSTSITGATSLAANTWYYVAVVRAGTGSNQTTLYVNAISDATGTSATTFSQTDNMKIGADRSNTNFANGYISNLRLSNTNRTISSTPTSALTADANTIFLGLYNNRFQYTDSTAAFTNMSVTGTPSVQAFSPFNPTSSWSAATNGGSGYFDGNGDYLTAPSNAAFVYGSSNYTIELWFYASTVSSSEIPLYKQIASGGLGQTSEIRITSSKIVGYIENTSFGGSTTVVPNTWYHVAYVRNGNVFTLYLNGNSDGSVTYSINLSSLPTSVTIAANQTPSFFYTGYISGLRIVKGTAVYTSNFTPPTAPLTNITNTSLLLNFTNAGIYDATSKNDLETVGNAQISTAQSKWGGSSMAFDGTGDWLFSRGSLADLTNFGAGDFTIEAWVRFSDLSGTRALCGKWGGASNRGWFFYYEANNIGFTYSTTGSNATDALGSWTPSINTWYYVAVTRSGANLRLYVDGSQKGTTHNISTSSIYASTSVFSVAQRGDDFGALNGYLQDLRITKGYARIITASPTAAFPTL